MKKLLSLILVTAALTAVSQPKKAPKMAPVLTPGYYVSSKGDTVRGEIQTNPDDETDFYHKFGFKPAKGGAKVVFIDTKKAKAYGYDNTHYQMVTVDGEELYLEKLSTGRINFFEYRFNGKIDGNPAIVSAYYIQDTRAEGADVGLKDIKKLSDRFYKKDLKPYMKDQPMIWTDLDKFTFSKQRVVEAINEFNKYYVIAADDK